VKLDSYNEKLVGRVKQDHCFEYTILGKNKSIARRKIAPTRITRATVRDEEREYRQRRYRPVTRARMLRKRKIKES
jgi:hypothetical protein